MSNRTLNITLATPANMRRFSEANPSKAITQDDGTTVHVEGRRCFAYSPFTGEEYSATAGDYFTQPDDEPITDSEGEPMVLAILRTEYLDALTGEEV